MIQQAVRDVPQKAAATRRTMMPLAVAASSTVTPLGDRDQTLQALFDHRSGFAAHPSRVALRNEQAALIADRPAEAARDGQWQRLLGTRMLRDVIAAAPSVWRPGDQRCAVLFATSYGHLLDDRGADTMASWARDCTRGAGCDLEPIVVGSGCSSGADALGVAAAMLDGGMIDAAAVVAVDIVTAAKRTAHSALGTMTTSEHRPFDVDRSGMLLGEGGAAVVLARSADCPACEGELLGIGAANDAYGLTAPDPSGRSVLLALDRALAAASLTYDDLSLYLAHGTATHRNDALEALVIDQVFAGHDDLVVVGTKGALGHSLGACGLIEFNLMLGMLAMRRAPGTVGLIETIDRVATKLAEPGGRTLLGGRGVSVTLGFGGFNTALIARA